MTNLDVLTGFESIPVGVAYRLGAQVFDEYPASLPGIENLEVEYTHFPGWTEDITAVRHYDRLPRRCREYVEAVEKLIEVPIEMLSVGPERDQVITRQAVSAREHAAAR